MGSNKRYVSKLDATGGQDQARSECSKPEYNTILNTTPV